MKSPTSRLSSLSSKTLAVVTDEFTLGSPAQQLVDRFLIGYPVGPGFSKPEGLRVRVLVDPSPSERSGSSALPKGKLLEAREKDFGLVVSDSLRSALAGTDVIIVALGGGGEAAKPELLREVIESAPRSCRCFVHGWLGPNLAAAKDLLNAAKAKEVRIESGTSLAGANLFPELTLPLKGSATEALVVVHGPAPACWLNGVETIQRVRGNLGGAPRVRFFRGAEVWAAADRGEWNQKLLGAALSRSNTTQGGAVLDGRTEDIFGLGIARKLASDPEACVIQHGKSRSVILQLTGAIKEINFAALTPQGKVISAQVYRPPGPAREEFSRLAATLERSDPSVPLWGPAESLAITEWMDSILRASKPG